MLGKVNSVILSASLVFNQYALAAQPVKVEKLTAEPLVSQIQIHGTVHGKRDVELATGTSGLLRDVVAPGTYVKQGSVLAALDTQPLELERAQHQETLNRAKINLGYYEQELARLQSLAKTNSAAISQVDLVRNQRDLSKSDIAMAEIKIRQVNDQIQRGQIKAPFDGVVSERFKMPNSEINRAERVVTLVDIDNLEVRLFAPIKYLNAVSLGQTVQLQSSSKFDLNQSQAIVDAIIPATDTRSQTFEIRASLAKSKDDLAKRWASGQLVDVTLPLHNQGSVLLVNRDALILRQGGVHVVKINADSKASKVPVVVGKGQGELVEIKPIDALALKVGDAIAVRGAERLTDGQEVEIQ